MNEDLIATLVNAGFAPTRYGWENELFHIKTVRLGDMEFFNLDNDDADPEWEVVVEILPDGKTLQFVVLEDDYHDSFPLDSMDGQTLLNQAINAKSVKEF